MRGLRCISFRNRDSVRINYRRKSGSNRLCFANFGSQEEKVQLKKMVLTKEQLKYYLYVKYFNNIADHQAFNIAPKPNKKSKTKQSCLTR